MTVVSNKEAKIISFPAALWGIKPTQCITTFVQTEPNDVTIYTSNLKFTAIIHATLYLFQLASATLVVLLHVYI